MSENEYYVRFNFPVSLQQGDIYKMVSSIAERANEFGRDGKTLVGMTMKQGGNEFIGHDYEFTFHFDDSEPFIPPQKFLDELNDVRTD